MASSSTAYSPSESEAEKSKCITKSGSNCLLFSPAFIQTPFVSPFPRPSNSNLVTVVVPRIVCDLRNSVASSTDRCFKLLHSWASQNPFLSNIMSLSSGYHNFCQIHCRNFRNMNSLSNHNFAAVLPGDSVAGLVAANGVMNFLNIYNTLLICRLVLTWFPNSPPAIVGPLSTLCDPYLNIFRGIIPPLGGTLDLSPILAFLVLNAFTSAATALPAELPSSQGHPSFHGTTQNKWMRRLCGNRSKCSGGAH